MNNPTFYADKYRDDGGFMLRKDQILSISPIIRDGVNLTEDEIDQVVAFLKTLKSSISADLFNKIMPETVPSNLEIHRIDEPVKYLQD